MDSKNKLATHDAKYLPPPFPLQNVGAICHFNALIQCLLSLSNVNYAGVLEVYGKKKLYKDNALLFTYFSIVKSLITTSGSVPSPGISLQLMGLFKEIVGNSFGNGAEDIQEGYVKLLDAFKCAPVQKYFNIGYEITTECDICKNQTLEEYKNCYTAVPGNCTNVEQFIKNNKEVVSNANYNCKKCNKQVQTITRQVILSEVNEAIVVSLNKYLEKKLVELPPILKINSKFTYKLVAQAEHLGGHYNAICLRNAAETPFLLDDASTPVQKQSITSTSDTYLAFYALEK
jgi:ubiquitin C-terminal hydrolase